MSQSAAPILLVLAAGMSSRYNRDGGSASKQTEAIGPCGETLLDYSVFDAKRAGFGRVVFVIRRNGEAAIRERVVSRLESQIPVTLVCQDINDLPDGFACPSDRLKPWGTGHAVWAARYEVDAPFCVINADDYYGRDSFSVMAEFLRLPGLDGPPSHWSMVGFRLRNTLSEHGRVARGLCQVSDGLLTGIEELTNIHRTGHGAENRVEGKVPRTLTGDETVSLNMWGFTTGVFPIFGKSLAAFLAAHGASPTAEFYIPSGVDEAIRQGSAVCRVLPTSSHWFGVTWPEDKAHVVAAVGALAAAGEYPSPVW